MTIKDLRLIVSEDYRNAKKELGVLLIETGFLKYKKLTAKNYNFWWYEVKKKEQIDERNYTYSWKDMEKTEKFKWIEKLIDFHLETESVFTLINNILNILSTDKNAVDIKTRKNEQEEVFEFYYEHRKRVPRQLSLF